MKLIDIFRKLKAGKLIAASRKRSKRGFVLIIVILLLALCTILVVGFVVAISNDYAASKTFSSGQQAHQLSDSTVQIVIGQIQQATTGAGLNWASQPGMIRTYDNGGNPSTNYKLYSSGMMTTTGILTVASPSTSGNNVNDFDPAWSSNSGLWVDLNSPVTDSTGALNYPIIDGNNLSTTSGISTYQPINGQTVQGFSVNNPPLSTQGATINPVPMPVQWLYQLKDGTIAGATASGSNTVTVTGASAANPIVGRIAFWTDDESSKININTACGDQWTIPQVITSTSHGTSGSYTPPGAFWDIPRCFTDFEYYSLAYLQPAQNEFQRYPGHPATVYLSAVFPNLTRDQIFSMVPRINGGGSEGGTTLATQAVIPDSDRLYSSVDELLFAPAKPVNDRTLNDPSTSILDKATMQRAKFFVTANSRAPEVNVFDQPRISIWPIDSDVITKETQGTLSPRGTAYDALIAFCSHVGPLGDGNDYCIQRQANGYMSQTSDMSIPRNKSLYSYLQGLMKAQLPGFGGNLSTKFGTDSDQIATEIFDYIRCTNPSDTTISSIGATSSNPTPNDANCYTPGEIYQTDYTGEKFLNPKKYSSFIAPSKIGTTQGFGRTVTISDLGLCFICCGDGGKVGSSNSGDGNPIAYTGPAPTNTPGIAYSNFPPLKNIPTTAQIAGNALFSKPTATGYASTSSPGYQSANWNYNLPTYDWANDPSGSKWTGLAPGQRRVKAIFLVDPYTVAPGYNQFYMDLGVEVKGLDSLQLTGISSGSGSTSSQPISLQFPKDNTLVMSSITNRTATFGLNAEFYYDGYFAPFRTLPENATIPSPQVGDATVAPTASGSGPGHLYPFVSTPITVDSTQSTMTLSGAGKVTINLWHLSQSDELTDQTVSGILTTPSASSTLIQTINTDFTQLTGFTVPTLLTSVDPAAPGFMDNLPNNDINNPSVYWDFSQNGLYNNGKPGGRMFNCRSGWPNYCDTFIAPSDSIRTLVPGYPTDKTGIAGDYRLLAAENTVPSSVFVPHRLMKDTPSASLCHSFCLLDINTWAIRGGFEGQDLGPNTGGPNYGQGAGCDFGSLVTSTPPSSAFNNNPNNYIAAQTGDYDNGMGSDMDGPYINKPDAGFNFIGAGLDWPYFYKFGDFTTPSFFSPNRQISSPGMFGSLPVGVIRQLPWQTLLFRPQPSHPDGVPVPDAGGNLPTGAPYGNASYGAAVADHMLMDFFWMPVVEPYAISEPFSTAGKINLNYQIAPFTYISRETAMDALLKSQRIMAIPFPYPAAGSSLPSGYKAPWGYAAGGGNGPAIDFRSDVNLSDTTGTLRQFQEKFAGGDLFRSASQICDIYLTPKGQSWTSNANATTFWANNQPTGDNTRERPYSNLYGCLTTKSNTYTVHFRVQTLQKVPTTPANEWVDGVDVVNSDTRGSSLIERYIDPSNSSLPDFTQFPADPSHTLGPYYKFRILSTRKFAP